MSSTVRHFGVVSISHTYPRVECINAILDFLLVLGGIGCFISSAITLLVSPILLSFIPSS